MTEEEETHEIDESKNEPTPNACERLCFHEGDRICYNEFEDKELLKKICHDEEEKVSTVSTESQDTIHSGESLFKTFTFEAPDSDPDMKKCMTFWKSILAKNVKPAKCTLLKSKKIVKEKKKKDVGAESADLCENEENREMWMNIYKDLQKRRLDKVKLGASNVKKSCDPCEDYVDEEMEKMQQNEEIKKLNNWMPVTTETGNTSKLNFQAQIKRTLSELRARRTSKSRSKDFGRIPSTSGDNKIMTSARSSITSGNLKTIYYSTDEAKHNASVPAVQAKNDGKVYTIIDKVIKSKESNQSPEIKSELSNKEVIKTSKEVIKTSKDVIKTSESEIKKKPSKSSSLTNRKPSTSGSSEPITIKQKTLSKLQEESQKSVTVQEIEEMREEIEVCCSCNCLVTECKCDENEDTCNPCDCGETCICDEITEQCFCGCDIEDCICNEMRSFEDLENCQCECGVEECICEELFTRSCRCGDERCSCDIFEIISTYMESLSEKPETRSEIDVKLTKEGLRFASKSIQTEGINASTTWTIEETEKEGSYCIICGHFNCFCKDKTPCYNKKAN